MRYFLTFAALFFTLSSFSQGIWNKAATNNIWNRTKADSVLIIPRDTTPTNGAFYLGAPVGDYGRVAIKDSSLYYYRGNRWEKIIPSTFVDSLNNKLDKPISTNNSLNALVVVDGQNKSYIRSTDSLPYVKDQFGGEQEAEFWISGVARAKGGLQKIDDGINQASLIDYIKSDASTKRGRMGYWNPGVFGTTDTWGALNFLGPSFLAAKKDSTVALATIDGNTVSAKLAIRGRNIFLRKSGIIVNGSGALIDSSSGGGVASNYFLDVNAGTDTVSASFTNRVKLGADAVNSDEAVRKGQISGFQSIAHSVQSFTGAGTVTIKNGLIFINNPASSTTITLPPVGSSAGNYLMVAISNTSAQNIAVGGYLTSDTGGGCLLICDGSFWRIAAKF